MPRRIPREHPPPAMTATNPLLADWTTPFALPPFDRIRASDFGPAFEAAMRAQRAEVEAIAALPDAPDFENTVAAFDRSGRLLSRIEAAFHALAASHTSPESTPSVPAPPPGEAGSSLRASVSDRSHRTVRPSGAADAA